MIGNNWEQNFFLKRETQRGIVASVTWLWNVHYAELIKSTCHHVFECIWILGINTFLPIHTPWLCEATPQSTQWKTLSESDMCADCEPDPGECCKVSVWDKTQNWNFTITEGQAGHALLAGLKRKNIWIFFKRKKSILSFCLSPLQLIWLNESCQQLLEQNIKPHSFIPDMNA